ncbi:MAG TPA: ABC transporter permease [Bryobacteraceae bacterium]|nr:ABC transporter permease [Bryobacteraceae bacterium]
MESFLQDCRYALRMLARNPGFTMIAVLALALGIGANSAIFSLVNAVILKPLPYQKPEQLVQLWMRFTNIGIPNDQNWVSAPEFVDLQQNQSLSHLAAISSDSFNINISGTPERIDSAVVSTSFFPLLGVQAQLGRVFLPEEGQPGRAHVVLLSDGLWRRRFGADPAISGRKVVMNGQSYLIVGVLPRDFQLPLEAEVWTPLVFSADDLSPNSRGNHSYQVIARIKTGLSLEQARADLDVVSQRIIDQHPDYPYRQFNFRVLTVPLLEQQIGGIKTALWVLMSAVGLVLLIACANVANLLLVRASAREREIAVRQALGVSRWRLIQQMLTESAMLGLMAGVIGLLLGYWALHLLTTLAATSFPRVAEAHMDLRVLAFTVLVSLATGILFGLAPAFSSRHVTHDALKEGGRGGTAGAGSQRLRGMLVVAEVALSLTLLVGAGLLIRSFLRLQEVDTGFRPAGVLTMRISLPEEKYAKIEQTRTFYRELLDRIRRLPGVDAVGGATGLPLGGTGWSGTATVDSQAVQPRDTTPEVDQRPVFPGYFEAMGIPLVRGRYFEQRDNEKAAPVAIIDETMANTYWPKEDALGKRIKPGGRQSTQPWRTIVGVVRHVRYRTLESPSRVEFYWPYDQTSFALGSMSLAIHTSSDPRSLAGVVQKQVQALDPDQPVYRIRTMSELMSESMARRRLSMFLLAIFAAVALALAAIGIYGIMSYSVAQRAHEVGIRMALGARSSDVVRMVLGQSLGLTLAGIFAGLLGSLALTNFLSSLLFDVKATDATTFLLVAVILAAVALVASLVPAYRATTVDPVNALRQE